MPDSLQTSPKPNLQGKLSVVIPCYNEEESFDELVKRVENAASASFPDSYELVFVNDGSKDQTWEKIAACSAKNSSVIGINLSRNYGHQIALSAGLQVCDGDFILILDADLQDPPELLPEMLTLMQDGAHVVYGQRIERKGESAFKLASASAFYKLIAAIVDVPIPRDAGDFRLMSRKALDAFNSMPEQHRFVRGMVSWIGFKQVPITYTRDARFAGETKYPLSKMVRLALDAITGFSVRPLRVAAYLSAAFCVLSVLVAIYVVYQHFQGHTVRGWASLILTVLLMGSAQLFVLAIIGEYVGRTFTESKRRPLFFISQIIGHRHE